MRLQREDGYTNQAAVNFYQKRVLPTLINLAMQNKADTAERAKLIPHATGAVLEVGAGSGLNIPFYGFGVKKLYALDPSVEFWKMAQKRVTGATFPIEFLATSAEEIPLEDMAVDTVVTTWTLCTIPDAAKALTEMRRVLKPRGTLLFIEHGWSPDPRVRAWQNLLNPLWRRVAGGCNLNRKIDELVAEAGFHVTRIEMEYNSLPKFLTYLYKGVAERLV